LLPGPKRLLPPQSYPLPRTRVKPGFGRVRQRWRRRRVRSVRHSNPELTLRQYAHMLPQAETDLSFADFGGPRRPYTAPALADDRANENAPGGSDRGHLENMERETGIARQPCWPSACDCVAANRRPSAWEENPNPRKISRLRSTHRRAAARSGIEMHWRRQTAPTPETTLNTAQGAHHALR